ncbi:MAG TPA: carboxypeptidase-like regulatory domain-containing protein [Segetibacter sp.]
MLQNILQIPISVLLIVLLPVTGFSQLTTISGTVYDITKKTPVEYVSVLSTSGKGTVTDSSGRYSLTLNETDSIYFSFLNKPTPKFPVSSIQNTEAFDISISRKIKELPAVFVKQRNYRLDSLQNRLDYEKIFNYRKPGIRTSMNPSPGSVSVGLDLDEFINIFKFKKNKRALAFQKRLEEDEIEKYINHRFSKGLVKKLTGLNPPEIDSFMAEYRPTFDMVIEFNDLEFGQFIIEAFKHYSSRTKISKQVFKKEPQ